MTGNIKDEREMPFLDHLEELRWRVIKSFSTVILMMIVSFVFSDQLFDLLLYPGQHLNPPIKLQTLKVQSVFMIKLELSIFAGIVLSLPVIFYQFWQFLAPGLLLKERKAIPAIVTASVICFLLGSLFAYFVIIPYALDFFLKLTPANIENNIAIDFYTGFLVRMILVFGIVFELPMLSLFLTKLGILNPKFMRKYRRHAIVMAFIVGAILTPPDPLTQIFLAVPLVILYEISIFVSFLFSRPKVNT
jgi:sec-independent protein translocase protein TatC